MNATATATWQQDSDPTDAESITRAQSCLTLLQRGVGR